MEPIEHQLTRLAACKDLPPELGHCTRTARNADEYLACMDVPMSALIRMGNAGEERPEAVFEIEAIAKKLEAIYARDHKFPVGSVGPTPAGSCCGKTGYCALDEADWNTGLWQAIGYKPTLPPLYQFTYMSDGSLMSITAVGDMDCDKNFVTYRIDGSIEDTGVVFKSTYSPTGID